MTISAKNIFLFLWIVCPYILVAQPAKIQFRDRLGDSTELVNTAVEPPKIKGPKVLTTELSAGVRLSTNGYSFLVDNGYIRSERFGQRNYDRFYDVRLFTFEVGEKLHAKEIKSSSGGLPGMMFQPSTYVLGKINNFYQVKLGYGRRQMIAGKPDPGTISMHWVYVGGFAAGLLKPYYINLGGYGEVKYSDSLVPDFVSPGLIIGKAPFSKGLDELKFVPGAFARTGLHLDFSTRRKFLIALEIGANGEIYTQKIPQMVGQDPKLYFLNFYASLQLGKRW